MKIKTVELYTYDELSDDAKEKAREWYTSAGDYPWSDDNRASLECFCNTFPVSCKNWEYDAWTYDVNPTITCDDEIEALSGARLVAYLQNNYARVFKESKVFKGKKVQRVSRIIKTDTCCPFTGYCMDEVLLDTLRAFIKKPDNRTFETLMEDCIDAWGKACRDDVAYQNSDEVVEDTILANDYTFTIDGKRED